MPCGLRAAEEHGRVEVWSEMWSMGMLCGLQAAEEHGRAEVLSETWV